MAAGDGGPGLSQDEQVERQGPVLHLEAIFGRERILIIDSDGFFADPGPAYDEVLGLPARTPKPSLRKMPPPTPDAR